MWLGYTEEQVWRLTPRKFSNQLKVHEDIMRMMHGKDSGKKPRSIPTAGFIDNIPGW